LTLKLQVAQIEAELVDKRYLDDKRDWGYVKEYVFGHVAQHLTVSLAAV